MNPPGTHLTAKAEGATAEQWTEMDHFHARLVYELFRRRFPIHDEKALQAEIEQVLVACGIPYAREVRVTGGIIDFVTGSEKMFPDLQRTTPRFRWPDAGCIGIEVKIKGSKRALYRQVERYAADPRIGRLVVVAGLPIALPPTIGGKPVTIVDVGRAWL